MFDQTEASPDADAPRRDNVLLRENAYLKSRCAQLQGDVDDLNAEINRLQQRLERIDPRTTAHRPDPLSGGQ